VLSNAAVTQWNDKSGNGRNATAFSNPLYDGINNAINFNGTQWMSNSVSSSLVNETAFIVVRNNNTNNINTMLGSSLQNGRQFRCATTLNGTTTGLQTIRQNVAGILLTTIPIANNIQFIAQFTNNGTTLVHYYNGIVAGSTSTNTYTANLTLLIGRQAAGEFMNGSIFEIIIYQNTALTTTQRQQVEGYLAWKWGLQGNLPSTHPYFRTPLLSTALLPIPLSIPIRWTRAPSWSPTAFSGLALWLDAADAATLFQDSGGTIPVTANGQPVGRWSDKSGFGRNGTATGTFQYVTNSINILPSIRFSGVANTFIRGNIPITGTTFTAFSVAIANSTTSPFSRILSLGLIGADDYSSVFYSAALYINKLTPPQITTYRNNVQGPGINIVYSQPFLSGCLYDGTNMYISANGTFSSGIASSGSFNIANYEIGNNFNEESFNMYNGFIGEVLVYNSALTNNQRQQVEGYLAWKWGLQGNLPASHPNRFIPP
jgi:hypothetical protein